MADPQEILTLKTFFLTKFTMESITYNFQGKNAKKETLFFSCESFSSDAEQGNGNEEASEHFVSKGIQQGHVYYINRQKVSGPFCYFNNGDKVDKMK